MRGTMELNVNKLILSIMNNRTVIIYIFFSILFINVNEARAQEVTKEYGLYNFLQNTCYSSIVSYSVVPRYYSHDYFIIGKKQEKIFLFTYKNPYEKIF